MSEEVGKDKDEAEKPKLPFWKTMLSVMQASFGVQSRANKERDFANGSVKGFIVAALIFTALFILTIVIVVRAVLP
jgi:hypothetical protein